MIPLELENITKLGMGDLLSDSGVSNNEVNQELIISESLEEVRDTLQAKRVHNNTFQKRVQFLPDGKLVSVREIPARSKTSSSESDGSVSESSSASSDSDSDGTDPDIDDDKEDDDKEDPIDDSTPPLLQTTIPATKNIETKESNNLVKNNHKQETTVVRAKSVQPPLPGPISPSAPKRSKAKRAQSPKLPKRIQHSKKQTEKTEAEKTLAPDSAKRPTAREKHETTNSKLTRKNMAAAKTATNSEGSRLLQRIKSSQSNDRLVAGRSNEAVVSTSLTLLPTAQDSYKEPSSNQAIKAMQSLRVEELYTVDTFCSSSYQISEMSLPELPQNVKRESTFLPSSNRGDITRRASGDYTQKQPVLYQQTSSKLSTNSNKGNNAWQMTNGYIANTLQNTPNIAQLFDSDYENISDQSLQLVPISKTLFNNIKKT